MKIKKFILLILCVFTIFMATACKKEEENYDFTIWCYQPDSSIKNYGENPVFKELEKRTGKKVKFILDIDYDNLVATKSYPEVILWLGYSGTNYGGGIADGVVKDITELVYNYAPNYKKIITSSEDLWNIVTVDSKIPAFYTINNGVEEPWQGYLMRKDLIIKYKSDFTTYSDWADLGEKDNDGNTLLTPITYEHWEDIFKVMKEKEGIEYPLAYRSKGYCAFDELSAGFDLILASGGWNNLGETLENGWVSDKMKDYVSLINKWYNLGYISPNYTQSGGGDISSSTAEIVGTKKSAPTSMCFYDAYNYIGSRVKKGLANGIEGYDLMAVPSPRLTKEQVVHTCSRIENGTGMSACITTKCSDELAKEIVEWFDYLYSEEGSLLMSWGIEGVTYTVDENGNKEFIDEIKDSPDKGLYNYVSSNFPGYIDLSRLETFQDSYAISAYKIWTYNDDGSYRINVTPSVDEDVNLEYTQKLTACTTYFEEELNKFIKGTRSVSEFDDYVSTMKSYGIDKVIEYFNAAYKKIYDNGIPNDWLN